MRKLVVIATVVTLLSALNSCEKNWTCSCNCTYYGIGGAYTTSSTIYNDDKAQAEYTCFNQYQNLDSCNCKVQ